MRVHRPVLACALALAAAGPGCPAPEPPPKTVARPLTEEDARRALEAAKKADDPKELLAVFHKFGKKSAAGSEALHLAARRLRDAALEAAEACDEPAAKGALAKIAPYTTDDSEIDALYDEVQATTKREKARCVLLQLDADVKKAELAWDWPRAFARITGEKDADGGALKKRREELTVRWGKWLDATLAQILDKKSLGAVVGDKRELLVSSVDASKFPDELSAEIGKRAGAVAGVMLVFDKLQDPIVLDPAVKYWTFGAAKARRAEAPASADNPVLMANGVPFVAVAKGKIGGVSLLVAGKDGSSALERLSAVKLLVPEAQARPFDTNATLPDQLAGVRVLAPIAAGSDVLAPSIVLSEANGVCVVEPLKKGAKVTVKRKELRGFLLLPGQKVQVWLGGAWKKGELTDAPESERVLVKVTADFESYFFLTDLRVKRGDLPKPPE